jgi:hypothetical protein
MYESPKLNRVGEAEEVILGLASTGDDMDGNWIPDPPLFAPESDLDDEADF